MTTAPASQLVIVVDFGAQYGQLIARRVRDLQVYSEIVPCDVSADEVRAMAPSAIILSGGPASVYAEDAPSIDPEIFELGIPVLGFCYGQQIMAVTLGGTVGHTEAGEYGAATLRRCDSGASALYGETLTEQTVWMSHRDAVAEVPEGFVVTASTDVCPVASMECALSLIHILLWSLRSYGRGLLHDLENGGVNFAQVLVVQGTLVIAAHLGEDFLFALGIVQAQMGSGLETADNQRMAGALVQQRDNLPVDLVDLGAMFLNLRKGVVFLRHRLVLSYLKMR